MKKTIKRILLGTALLLVAVTLSACSFTKKSKFIDGNKIALNSHEKVTASIKPGSNNSSDDDFASIKMTAFTDEDKDLAYINTSQTDTSDKTTNSKTYVDAKKGNMYIDISSLLDSYKSLGLSSSDLNSFDGKYIKYTDDDLKDDDEKDATSYFSGLMTSKKIQDEIYDQFDQSLKDADSKSFTSSDKKITHKWTKSEMRSLVKGVNNVMKKHKDTKDSAMSSDELQDTYDQIDHLKVTETVSTDKNMANFKITYKGDTYNVKTTFAKSNKKISLPKNTMSTSEFQSQFESALLKGLMGGSSLYDDDDTSLSDSIGSAV